MYLCKQNVDIVLRIFFVLVLITQIKCKHSAVKRQDSSFWVIMNSLKQQGKPECKVYLRSYFWSVAKLS